MTRKDSSSTLLSRAKDHILILALRGDHLVCSSFYRMGLGGCLASYERRGEPSSCKGLLLASTAELACLDKYKPIQPVDNACLLRGKAVFC
jgi:hypothetical protein